MVLPIIQRTTSTTGTENEKNPLIIEFGIQSHSLFFIDIAVPALSFVLYYMEFGIVF